MLVSRLRVVVDEPHSDAGDPTPGAQLDIVTELLQQIEATERERDIAREQARVLALYLCMVIVSAFAIIWIMAATK